MDFKSRKLIMAAVLILGVTAFMIFQYSTFDQWSEFVRWVFSGYVVGNVGEHYVTKGKQ